jgi:hypothetical protein
MKWLTNTDTEGLAELQIYNQHRILIRGPPKSTYKYSSVDLADMGMIGVYIDEEAP